ncbi:hypothetical protein M0R45_020295 [Rubus argutus]|uniref:Uncharacterized protein n=1 Tax=Rubus argutus TaxID=59490 RepID=A0AAW1XAB5_RUBAR
MTSPSLHHHQFQSPDALRPQSLTADYSLSQIIITSCQEHLQSHHKPQPNYHRIDAGHDSSPAAATPFLTAAAIFHAQPLLRRSGRASSVQSAAALSTQSGTHGFQLDTVTHHATVAPPALAQAAASSPLTSRARALCPHVICQPEHRRRLRPRRRSSSQPAAAPLQAQSSSRRTRFPKLSL